MPILIIAIIVIIYILAGLKIVPQNYVGLVETLGKYSKTVKAGLVLSLFGQFFKESEKLVWLYNL